MAASALMQYGWASVIVHLLVVRSVGHHLWGLVAGCPFAASQTLGRVVARQSVVRDLYIHTVINICAPHKNIVTLQVFVDDVL